MIRFICITFLFRPKESKQVSYHVDAFIYDDQDVEELVTKENFPRNLCVKCGSVEVKPVGELMNYFNLLFLAMPLFFETIKILISFIPFKKYKESTLVAEKIEA